MDIVDRLQECADNFPVIEDHPYSVLVDAKDEITTLRQQLEQAEAKADLFRRACEDLLDDRPIAQAYILRKQAEAVEKFGQEIGVFDPEYDDQEYVEVPRREVKAYAQRLRQQADEIEND
jgi:hypothetical protein